jgi:hypothetical protein
MYLLFAQASNAHMVLSYRWVVVVGLGEVKRIKYQLHLMVFGTATWSRWISLFNDQNSLSNNT